MIHYNVTAKKQAFICWSAFLRHEKGIHSGKTYNPQEWILIILYLSVFCVIPEYNASKAELISIPPIISVNQ